MNKAIITGRWTKNPDIRFSQGAEPMAIAKGSIAVNRKGKDKGADFINVVAFGKTAEHIEKYYKKGMKADICGHIQTGSYDHKDGYKVYTTEIVIDEIEFGESKNAGQATQKLDDDFVNVPDDVADDLPFN